jgi:ATP-dependent protease ClpP protease subunit
MKKTMIEVKNQTEDLAEIWVYGVIVSGSDKWDDDDVILNDFREAFDNLSDTGMANMYINSPGGSLPASQGIIAVMIRAMERGITINAYLDGIGASCASLFPLVSTNRYCYKSSLLMVHLPMLPSYGNRVRHAETISMLEKFEEDVMIPIYESCIAEGHTVEELKQKLDDGKDHWFNAAEMADFFNFEILNEDKNIQASLEEIEVLKGYENVPIRIKNLIEKASQLEPESRTQENIELLKLKMELTCM